MRYLILAFILLILMPACKKPQSFEYRGMQNLKIDSIGLVNSQVSLDLVYFNPNNFGVNLKNINCDVFINHNFLGKYFLDTIMHIAKRSEFILPSSMKVDMKNVYKNAFSTLLSNKVLIELKGSTKIGKGGIYVTIPFDYSTMEHFDLF